MSYAIQTQVGAKGSPSMMPTGSRMAFGYGGGSSDDSVDALVGQSADEARTIATKLMADHGVKVQITGDKATGVMLTREAIDILKDNLGLLGPSEQLSALKIIAAYEYPPRPGIDRQVGAADSQALQEVGEAAITAVPGGGLVLSTIKIAKSVGTAFKSLFGGPSKADQDRINKVNAFLAADGPYKKAFQPLSTAFNAKGAAYDLSGYRPTGSPYSVHVLQPSGGDAQFTRVAKQALNYTLPNPAANDPKMVELLGEWQRWAWIANSVYAVASSDNTKSKTNGSLAVDYWNGTGAYAAGTDGGKNRGAAYAYGKSITEILQGIARDFYARFSQLYDAKGTLLPTQGDLSSAASGLATNGNADGQNLGNSIATGQSQIGKTPEEVAADLVRRASARVVKEGKVVKAREPFTVGNQIGAEVVSVRNVKPGDAVTKGELLVADEDIKIVKGRIQKAGFMDSTTGKLVVFGGAGAAVLAVAGLIFARRK